MTRSKSFVYNDFSIATVDERVKAWLMASAKNYGGEREACPKPFFILPQTTSINDARGSDLADSDPTFYVHTMPAGGYVRLARGQWV